MLEPSIQLTTPDEAIELSVLGDPLRIILAGAQTGGAVTVIEISHSGPGLGIPPHVHAHEDETFTVLEGEYEFIAGENVLSAGVGTTVFLPKGSIHGFRSVGERRNRLLVHIVPSGIERMFEELAALPSDVPPDLEKVFAICARQGITFLPLDGKTS